MRESSMRKLIREVKRDFDGERRNRLFIKKRDRIKLIILICCLLFGALAVSAVIFLSI